jgi:hypothetical protein
MFVPPVPHGLPLSLFFFAFFPEFPRANIVVSFRSFTYLVAIALLPPL